MIRLAGGAGGGSAGPASVVTALKGSGAGNYSTSSNIYVAVDAVNLEKALTTPITQWIMMWAAGEMFNTAGTFSNFVAILKDGVAVAENSNLESNLNNQFPWALTYAEVGDGASHTWALGFRCSNGTVAIQNGSATLTPFLSILQLAAT